MWIGLVNPRFSSDVFELEHVDGTILDLTTNMSANVSNSILIEDQLYCMKVLDVTDNATNLMEDVKCSKEYRYLCQWNCSNPIGKHMHIQAITIDTIHALIISSRSDRVWMS